MNPIDLDKLYEAISEDLLFGIGVMLTETTSAPYIHIFYRDWTRQQLEVIRESFKGGLTLTLCSPKYGKCDLYLATREKIVLQADEDGHTSVLRGPAWDARLENVEASVVRQFEANRKCYGGFMLLIQTLEAEFPASVTDADGRTVVGTIRLRSLPTPSSGAIL